MSSLFSQPETWLGLIGTVGTLLISQVVRKYVIPFLSIGRRSKYAQYIALIADELTDELRLKYPTKDWTRYADEAVDRLIEICEIDLEVARRAINASMARQND